MGELSSEAELAMVHHVWALIRDYPAAQRARILDYVKELSDDEDGNAEPAMTE